MNILTILFLLEMGSGQNVNILYTNNTELERNVVNDNYITFSAEAMVFEHIKIYGSNRTHFLLSDTVGYPNTGVYAVGAAGVISGLEFGIKHECIHDIATTHKPDIRRAGGYTYLYVSVKGEINVF